MTTQAPDALRLVPELVDWFGQYVDRYVEETNGPDADALIAVLDRVRDSYRREAAAPAVQPAAGRDEIARALDLLNEARNGGFFIGTDAGAKVEEAKDVLRDILAAIPTPAQASETGGERWSFLKARVDTLVNILAPDQGEMLTEEGRRLFAIASAIQSDLAALSAPQAAPGEGEE